MRALLAILISLTACVAGDNDSELEPIEATDVTDLPQFEVSDIAPIAPAALQPATHPRQLPGHISHALDQLTARDTRPADDVDDSTLGDQGDLEAQP